MASGDFLKFIQFWPNIRSPNLPSVDNGAMFDTPGVPGGAK